MPNYYLYPIIHYLLDVSILAKFTYYFIILFFGGGGESYIVRAHTKEPTHYSLTTKVLLHIRTDFLIKKLKTMSYAIRGMNFS